MASIRESASSFYQSVCFDPTPIGQSARKTFEIREFSEDRVLDGIVYDKFIDKLDEIFRIEYSKQIPKNQRGSFIVTYTPIVPFRKVCTFFEVVERNGHNINLLCLGQSVGPLVNASVRELEFSVTKANEERTRTIEFKNSSSVDAEFHFDIDNATSPFTVDKLFGTIPAGKHLFVRVRYTGTQNGVYATKLVCLIRYHSPIVIDCLAMNNLNSWPTHLPEIKSDFNYVKYPVPAEEAQGFQAYMSDAVPILKYDPPYSLTTTHLDFGYVKTRSSLGFSLTSHLKSTSDIFWDSDFNEVFKISPTKCEISSEGTCYFEVIFEPNSPDQFYNMTLAGLMFWATFTNTYLTVPIPLQIRLMGNSFEPENGSLIPQVALQPMRLIMPPCLPSNCVYATMILLRKGELPVQFKFVQPYHTNFVLKPMQGILKNSFQIIVVAFCPEFEVEDTYDENWILMLNGTSNYNIHFTIHGRTEYPSILVGENNEVHFRNSHPKCEQGLMVKLWNKTRHSIKYDIKIPEPRILKIPDYKGILAGHECTYILWLWTAPQNTGIQVVNLELSATAVCYKETEIGFPRIISLLAIGATIPTELCALPQDHNFQEIELQAVASTSFNIYNFGESDIHYELLAKPRGLVLGNPVDDITIDPLYGTIGPREMERITITVCPSEPGLHQFRIIYNIRKHIYSEEIVEVCEKIIFRLDYFCVIPVIQVQNLYFSDAGPTISKITMWNLLNINKLNEILKIVQEGVISEIDLNVPDEPLESDLTLFIVLKNMSPFPTEVTFKRKQLCDCKRVKQKSGITFTKNIFECPHREIVSITPLHQELMKYECFTLQVDVKYKLLEQTTLGFILSLSNNRQVQWNIKVKGLPNENPSPSLRCLEQVFMFKDVFIGDDDPVVQFFWLYNNTGARTRFVVNTYEIDQLNHKFQHKIFDCLNPIDFVGPFGSTPLKVKFSPIEMRQYEGILNLLIGGQTIRLKLIGNGSVWYDRFNTELYGKSPIADNCPLSQSGVQFSKTHIVVTNLEKLSTVERLLFISNTSPRVIGYRWIPVFMENILKVEISGRKGVLHPNEKRSLRVCIHSFNTPCYIRDLVITCEVLDLTKRREYEKTVVDFERELEIRKGEFILTEHELKYLKPECEIAPKPNVFHETISISCVVQFEEGPEEYRQTEYPLDDSESLFSISSSNNTENMKLISDVLHCLLRCDDFRNRIKTLCTKPATQYNQIVQMSTFSVGQDESEKCPNDKEKAQILKTISLLVITEIFGLQSVNQEPLKDKPKDESKTVSNFTSFTNP